MKKLFNIFVLTLVVVSGSYIFSNSVLADGSVQDKPDEVIILTPGWNIVSTPKVLERHYFSADESVDNFEIYILDATKTSKWATMADYGQTEFEPLYGYFINNKTDEEQRLSFVYKRNLEPGERFFTRTFSQSGWYSIGVANPKYTLPFLGENVIGDNNSETMYSLEGSYDYVVDMSLVNGKRKATVTNSWDIATPRDVNELNNFREGKGYVVYINKESAEFIGLQDEPGEILTKGEADLRWKVNQENPGAFIIKGENNKSVTTADLLVFDIESRDADTELETIEADIIVSAGSVSDVVKKAVLYQGGTKIDSQNITATTSTNSNVVFDLRNYYLFANNFETFSIRLELNTIDGTLVTDNTLIEVKVTKVEGYDESDNKVTKSSTVSSKVHTYGLSAAELTNFKWNTSKAGSGNSGIITFQFTVNAFDDDFTFSTGSLSVATTGSATINLPTWSVVSGTSYVNLSGDDYTVDEDEQVTFEVLWNIAGPGSASVTVDEVAGQSVPYDKQSSGSQVF